MVTRSYFDASRPFDSIMQFAAGEMLLTSEEQPVFFKTATDFFIKTAFQIYLEPDKQKQYPRLFAKKAFFTEALPVFLRALDDPIEKKQRLLACIKKVTKPYFPKLKAANDGPIDETTLNLRHAIDEIKRDGVSETANIYTKPLKKRKTTEKTAFEMLLNSACHNEEDRDILFEMLKEECAHGQSHLITELTKHLSDQQLAPLFEKIPTDFFILDEKELTDGQKRQLRFRTLQLAKPDLSVLTKEEIEQFVHFCINRGKTITECIKHILKRTKHREAILDNFEKRADDMQKQAIIAFWQKNFFSILGQICPVDLPYCPPFFPSLAKQVPITSETSLDPYFKHVDFGLSIHREKLQMLHRRLRDLDVLELSAKRPDIENLPLTIMLAIEKGMRSLEGERKKERFIALFSNLLTIKPNFEEFLSKWLCAAFQGFGYESVEDWKRSDELGWSDEIALTVHRAFAELHDDPKVNEWLPDVVRKRIQDQFSIYCEIPFRNILTAVNSELAKLIPENENRDKELSFVRAFLRSAYGSPCEDLQRSKNLLITSISQLIQAKELDLQEVEWVVQQFKHEAVGKHLPAIAYSPKLDVRLEETLAGEQLGTKLLKEHPNFFQPDDHGYLKAILGILLHARGEVLNLRRIAPCYAQMPCESLVRIALFCREEQGMAWMKEHVKEIDLCHSITQSLEITVKNWSGTYRLTQMIDDYLNQPDVTKFIEAIKERASDRVLRFFKIWLPQLSRSDSNIEAIRIYSYSWMVNFGEEDWKSFEKICGDKSLLHLLTREGLKNTLITMKEFFPVVYIAQLLDYGLSIHRGFGIQDYEAQQKTRAVLKRYEREREFAQALLEMIFLNDDCLTLSEDTLSRLIQKKFLTRENLERLIGDLKKEPINESFAHYGKIEIYQQMLTHLAQILESFPVKLAMR